MQINNNPPVPLDVIEKIDEVCNQGKEFNVYSWVPMGLGELWAVINYGQTMGFMQPGQTVMDMGSGSGSASLLWAVRGYNVLGIELYKNLFDASKDSILRCRDLVPKGLEIKICHGSYYPGSYIEKREKGKSIAKRIEDSLSLITGGDSIFHPIYSHGGQDIYKRDNIDLKSIDVWYAYIWGIQGPSIMEMFKQYAHKDATLCIAGQTHKEVIKRIGLVSEPKNDYDIEWCNFSRFRFMKKPGAKRFFFPIRSDQSKQ